MTEGEGFEPSVDRKAHNGFRDRADPAAMPHYNWSLHPGGMQGGMNPGRRVVGPIGNGARQCCSHRERHSRPPIRDLQRRASAATTRIR